MNKRYPITMMCAACIPWTENWKFDEASFREQVKHLIDHEAKSIYIFGTAGEGYAINTEVFKQVTKAFIDECSKGTDVMPMTGIISTSMMEMIDRIEVARALGCKDFQVALPCWGALNDDEVIDFFSILCKQFPDCRFIHYNNGIRSKKLCRIRLYSKIAESIPNLVAVKYSTGDTYELYNIITEDCPITFYIVDGGYTYASMKGKCGFLNSFASIDMDLSWKYFYAGQNRDFETLLELDSYFRELSRSFDFIDREIMDSALDKTIEKVANSTFSNTLFPPYRGLTEEEYNIVQKQMKTIKEKYNRKGKK